MSENVTTGADRSKRGESSGTQSFSKRITLQIRLMTLTYYVLSIAIESNAISLIYDTDFQTVATH